MRRYEPTDEEKTIIQPLLPNRPRGVPQADDRRVIKGILRRFRTSAPWRDVAEVPSPRTTLCNRVVRWRVGAWDRIPEAVSEACHGDIVMIHSSCLRVQRRGGRPKKGGNGGTGRSRPSRRRHAFACRAEGGPTPRIHALADAEGRPVRLIVTPGQAGDAPVAWDLMRDVAIGDAPIAGRA